MAAWAVQEARWYTGSDDHLVIGIVTRDWSGYSIRMRSNPPSVCRFKTQSDAKDGVRAWIKTQLSR